MCECAFDLALEGISRIRKCSPEGRLAMTLDIFDLHAGLNRIKNNPSSSSSSSSSDVNSPSEKTKNKSKHKDKSSNNNDNSPKGKEKEMVIETS